MKYLLALLLAAVLLVAAVTEPILNRTMLITVEKRIDQRLETLYDEPFLLLGMARGLYLDKFGAVFSAELQLVSTPGLGTFGFTVQNVKSHWPKSAIASPLNCKLLIMGQAYQQIFAIRFFTHSFLVARVEAAWGLP